GSRSSSTMPPVAGARCGTIHSTARRARGVRISDDKGVAGLLDRLEAGVDRGIAAGRRRSKKFDHVWRAQERYFDVDAGRLAAAGAYYGFFSVFAMAVMLFFILGRVFRGNITLVVRVQAYL